MSIYYRWGTRHSQMWVNTPLLYLLELDTVRGGEDPSVVDERPATDVCEHAPVTLTRIRHSERRWGPICCRWGTRHRCVWTRPCYTYSNSTQWAAVRTHLLSMRDPPQMCVNTPLLYLLELDTVCSGEDPSVVDEGPATDVCEHAPVTLTRIRHSERRWGPICCRWGTRHRCVWTRPCYTYSNSTQCAAVRTHLLSMRDPPQMCVNTPLLYLLELDTVRGGEDPSVVDEGPATDVCEHAPVILTRTRHSARRWGPICCRWGTRHRCVWTRPCYTYSISTQWAAVRTHLLSMRDPPQMCVNTPLLYLLELDTVRGGEDPSVVDEGPATDVCEHAPVILTRTRHSERRWGPICCRWETRHRCVRTRPCYTYSNSTQCAAVRTHLLSMRDPPQMCVNTPLLHLLELDTVCGGEDPSVVDEGPATDVCEHAPVVLTRIRHSERRWGPICCQWGTRHRCVWTRPCYTYSNSKQWAAVRTHLLSMRDPPQMCVNTPLLYLLELDTMSGGEDQSVVDERPATDVCEHAPVILTRTRHSEQRWGPICCRWGTRHRCVWTRPCCTYSNSTQCAAVRTHLLSMRDPPQMCVNTPLLYLLDTVSGGEDPSVVDEGPATDVCEHAPVILTRTRHSGRRWGPICCRWETRRRCVWTRPCYTYSNSTQWAAVRTHLLSMRNPPQMWVNTPLLYLLEFDSVSGGEDPSVIDEWPATDVCEHAPVILTRIRHSVRRWGPICCRWGTRHRCVWTRPCYTYSNSTQCAAVRTHRLSMRDPPQMCVNTPLLL